MFTLKPAKLDFFIKSFLLVLIVPITSYLVPSILLTRILNSTNTRPIANGYTTIEDYGKYLDNVGPYINLIQQVSILVFIASLLLVIIIPFKFGNKYMSGSSIRVEIKFALFLLSILSAVITLNVLGGLFIV